MTKINDSHFNTVDCIILERHVKHGYMNSTKVDNDGVIAYIPSTDSIVIGFQEPDMNIPFAYANQDNITLL